MQHENAAEGPASLKGGKFLVQVVAFIGMVIR